MIKNINIYSSLEYIIVKIKGIYSLRHTNFLKPIISSLPTNATTGINLNINK